MIWYGVSVFQNYASYQIGMCMLATSKTDTKQTVASYSYIYLRIT